MQVKSDYCCAHPDTVEYVRGRRVMLWSCAVVVMKSSASLRYIHYVSLHAETTEGGSTAFLSPLLVTQTSRNSNQTFQLVPRCFRSVMLPLQCLTDFFMLEDNNFVFVIHYLQNCNYPQLEITHSFISIHQTERQIMFFTNIHLFAE